MGSDENGPAADVPELRHAVLAWAGVVRRDLPWRRTRDPWAILVSELMLQQTQVARVVAPFELFMERFPDPGALAGSPVAAAIDAWAGLGYNRRAVALHRAATTICERHHGRVPDDLSELLALSGVGPYTARAVLVFAYERDVGVVDTNVARLLARWWGSTAAPTQLQERADALVPPGRSWDWNQALFDLGATVCHARSPQCARCPTSTWCSWRGQGPDPDVRGRSPTRFEGSDRQGRGRLVEALRRGPVTIALLGEAMGWASDAQRARRVADGVIRDGLAALDHSTGTIRLPDRDTQPPVMGAALVAGREDE